MTVKKSFKNDLQLAKKKLRSKHIWKMKVAFAERRP